MKKFPLGESQRAGALRAGADPGEALRQPFLGKGKEVIALGVSFSSAEKAVAEWKAAPYESLPTED